NSPDRPRIGWTRHRAGRGPSNRHQSATCRIGRRGATEMSSRDLAGTAASFGGPGVWLDLYPDVVVGRVVGPGTSGGRALGLAGTQLATSLGHPGRDLPLGPGRLLKRR